MDLTTLLRARAEHEQNAALFTFLTFRSEDEEGRDAVESSLSYAQLDARARAIAAALQERCQRGDRAVLLYAPSLEYIAAFFGCLYAGVIATPAYPPDPTRMERTLPRLRAIVSDAKASVVLTTQDIAAFAPAIFELAPDLERPSWLATDTFTDPSGWRPLDPGADSVAFLQYTSGSTGDPKGVVLTHANLIANERMITDAFRADRSARGVGWLPLYHDMGLIGNVLQPIAVGFPCVLMSPMDFLRRPIRWLEAISRYRATISGGPNFAYDLCVRKVDERRRAGLDLSTWGLAFNGAEPIRADTLRRFADAFAPSGFRETSFYACYGLAEATLLVTGSKLGAGTRVEEFSIASIEAGRPAVASNESELATRRALVGCGRPVGDERVVIVDAATRELTRDGDIGEIWVCGDNVSSGYWQRQHEAFAAKLESDDGRSYLRTGDLGFIRDGELFVTGRLKDLLIVRGRNIYPHDVEATVEDASASVRRGCVACFAVEAGGEERPVVVAEIDRRVRRAANADAASQFDATESIAAIRRAVAQAHELALHAIVLIETGSIPKTSSGKIQRFATKQAFSTGALSVVASDVAGAVAAAPHAIQALSLASLSAADVQSWLIAMAARSLGVGMHHIDADAPFASFGLDSMSAVELTHIVEAQLDVVVSVSLFLGARSLRAVAEELSKLALERTLGRGPLTEEAPVQLLHQPDEERRELPLSGNQESLWYLQELDPSNAAYNLDVVAQLRGPLGVEILQEAVRAAVRRHPILRTTYRRTANGPRQIVHAWLEPAFVVHETSAPLDALLADASRLSLQPFDLEHGPMLRVTLWRRSDEEAVLMLTTHHVAIDLWSVVILLGELRTTYAELARGSAPSLGPATATYEQFIAWQDQRVHSHAAERTLAYWRQHAGDLPPLELPTDRVRPIVQTFRGSQKRFAIDPRLGDAVVAFARREGVTPYAVMLAAYAALLSRFSGQSRFAVGTPSSGRDRRAFEDIIGYFVNTIPLRVELDRSTTFVKLVHALRGSAVAGLEHAWMPFSRVAAHLGAGRDRSRSPIFQTMFAYEQAPRRKDTALAALALSVPGESVSFGDIRAESAPIESQVSVLDLTLVVVALGAAPATAWMQYNADLFDADTIERMIGCFQILLEGALAAPETRVARLPILDAPQRRTLLVEWNDTSGAYEPELHIHHLFEENARFYPDKIAVEFEGQKVAYAVLNARANVLARELVGRGCGRGAIVGICVERSIEMIVGLIAIVKSGAGFLPIDESYPADRLSYMFEDSKMMALVTHSQLVQRLPAVPRGVELVYVDTPRTMTPDDSRDLELPIHRHDPFCILYTSGSTGRPKGVVLEHIGMVNHMNQQQELFGLCRESRMLQYFSMSGDGASIGEIWPALGAGATLVVTARREDSLMPGEPIRSALRTHHINYQLLPPVLGALTDPGELPELEMVSFGGDACSEDIIKRWARPGRRVHNMWGPTEATMITVAGECSADEDMRPPIGTPLLNTTAYVLDDELQPVPIGVVGELHIGGGVALARGYFNRPSLTAEKFIPDPFASNERLYKTGDYARWLPDGRLDCLGRMDTMVKVYSQRIDLAEVESVLRLDPAVVDAVVIVREDSPGDKRLVAYIIANGEVSDLRALAREKLPAFMVPSAIVTLDRFPLSPYGKIDRKAMPAPQGGLAAAEYIAPRDATEETIARIWQAVLKLERVGVLDNFYDLGGNSLLATQVVSRVHDELGVELPLRELFDATVADLAQRLAGHIGQSGPAMTRRPQRSAPPLSYAQSRLWFLDQLEPGSAAYNVPGAARLRGALDTRALERSLQEVVSRHEALRTTFEERDGEPIQRIHAQVEIKLSVIDVSALPELAREQRVRELALEEAQGPFDLARGPLLRARLVRLEANDHVLLFTMHHIVSDGWSLGILVREVTALYAAYAAGQPSPLPELALQYADYAAWQRTWLEGEELERQLGYWKTALEGMPPSLELPADRPRPPVQTFRGATLETKLGAGLKRAVQETARKASASEFMTLLSAFAVLLRRYSGQNAFVVGSPIANRTRRETEGMIGFFVNTLALGLRVDGQSRFLDLLADVKESTLGAYAHQDLPFEKLVDGLRIERDLSRSPVFQVMFALQNTPASKLALPGLAVTVLQDEGVVAKFDLTLAVEERDDGYALLWEYNTDLFERGTIARMATHFELLLRAALEHPEDLVAQLPLLTAAEEHRLLVEWGSTQPNASSDEGVHQLVQAQAALRPDAPALVYEGGVISYRELDSRADHLAAFLQDRGVGRETVIALYLPRGPRLVIAALATLKCGAAYLPLDTSYPEERTRQIVEESGARWVVVDGAPRFDAPSLDLGRIEASDARAPRPARRVHPDALAYVIYTSGSTGRPKGVAITHGSLGALSRWTHRTYGVTAADACSWIAGVAFDASVWEIWSCLTAGAALHIPPDTLRADPSATADWIARSRLTCAFVPTPVGDAIFREGHGIPGLRWLHVGGQQLGVRPPRSASYQVGNQYGPAETTVICTSSVIRSDGPIDIGRPIDGVQVYVVDEALQLVPQGVPGELCVGGDTLARGYLTKPELTAERFVPDPFSQRAGARMYRTGDVVRWRSGGYLELIGRTDHQVKLRGFRIELGEVESALREAGAQDVAVLAREDQPGDKRLVAYVVSSVDAEELRARSSRWLPQFMVPSVFVVLDALPLTPNGKLDRKALPAPERTASAEYVAPRTSTEEALANIWRDVLRIERVGVQDNFFELGGHSLLATQVVARIRKELGREPPLKDLFEAPTVESLAARLEAREKFAGLRLARDPHDTVRPLSYAQSRLWFLDRLEPGTERYNMPGGLRLRGKLEPAVLARCLHEVVRRHESLRTTFEEQGDLAVQRIHSHAEVPLPVEDWSALPAPARERRACEREREEAKRPFDLSRGPLLRATLLKLGADDHVLLFTMHHIISDGWSLGVLVREMTALYEAYVAGRESPLPALEVQYADFAAWQRAWLEGEELDKQLDYWTTALAGMPFVLDLPTDRPRPPVQTFRGATLETKLDAEVKRALQATARAANATEFMALLSAFGVLLHRYSGQNELVIGSPIANRTRQETEGLIGFFVNTLVLGLRIDPESSFQAMLKDVRERALGAFAHQDLPFEKLVDALKVERALSRSPVFQVMFALQNTPAADFALPGLEVSRLPEQGVVAKYDLTLIVTPSGGGYLLQWEYNKDLFDASTIERMAAHFQVLLDGIATRPERRIGELRLMTAAQERRLLVDWNETAAAYPHDALVHELFEAQVERTPDAIALVFEDERLTYRQLNARANLLAHELREFGVTPDMPVGVFMERSTEMVVAILGTLKAGGAYVPIDPQYPASRVDYMLADAAAPVVITQSALLPALGSRTGVVALDRDGTSRELFVSKASNPTRRAHPSSLAYVIYTSGSTGRPKGAMNTHAGLLNHMHWIREASQLTREDVVLQKTSFSFDASVWEFFLPLIVGARLVVARPEGHKDSNYLCRAIAAEGVTTLQVVPSMLRVLIEEPAFAQCRALRRVFSGGEALTRELATRFHERSDADLFNLYGPTETVIDVSFWQSRPEEQGQAVPIGRPTANTRLYVLDARMEPVPVGVAGELYVGGVQVARGYRARPELTAERFVPSPFGRGERLYRTGDLARWRADGVLEYAGRIDHQVKVRGFRIELGEIESALAQHASVGNVAVLAREDTPGDKRVVAYVVPARQGEPLDLDALRKLLEQRLPEYMVPSAFVQLEALPLTPNGKLDRKALPVPGVTSAAHARPRNAKEESLLKLWQELLGVEQIGINDDFFDLGGHSLLVTQFLSRVRSTFGEELEPRELFEAPTIASFGALLKGPTAATTSVPLVARVPGAPLPLSYAQSRLWFLDQLEPGSAAYNMPGGLRLRGRLDVSALERSLRGLVRRHEALRTTFEEHDGEPVQRIHAHIELRLAVEDLSAVPELERESRARELAREEAQRPFDLSRGPLLRARLLSLAADEHVLLLTLHHIVSDGWSIGILLRDVAAMYEAYASGGAPALPELPLQYADYAAWQRQWLEGEELGRQLEYWKAALDGMPLTLELPTDRPRPHVQTFRGSTLETKLGAELKRAVQETARHANATEFMTLLSVFGVLLHRYTGQTELVIGSPIANRTRQETEGLIGFFVNSLALGLRVEGQSRFSELLRDVKERMLGAYAHQDLPFERLVDALKIERALSRSPVFQVMFALQSVPAAELRLPGLEITALETQVDVAKLDLTLSVEPSAEGYQLVWEYNTDLFERETIARMAGQFELLLTAAVTEPDSRVSQLPTLTAAEKTQLLEDWTATQVSYAAQRSVSELFEAQVDRRPEATALVFEGRTLCYRELDVLSNRIAHALQGLGVVREERVGVFLPRSLELVATLLGVLKAGAAYLPLDPGNPAERNAYMLADSGARVVVTQKTLRDQLECAHVIVLEVDGELPRASQRLGVTMHPSSAAYMIYTSGSTGRPKGAVNTHAGLFNRLQWMQQALQLDDSDTFVQKTPFSFDVSVWEFFSPLIIGARLVLARPEGHKDPGYLCNLIETTGITTLHFVPSMLEQFLDAPQLGQCASLRRVVCSGEALGYATTRRFHSRLGAKLHNLYGPTEASIDVTWWQCSPEDPGPSVPIGRPIANTQTYILDSELRAVPIGVAGELHLGGVQLCRGYAGRAGLTAERFVPNPFAHGERLYRTGDLARWRADGAIEYLGRLDHQVKIRGFRIELGEIESVLAEAESVREAVVVAREDTEGDKRLVAYVVPSEQAAFDEQALRERLKRKLPEYMTPSAFVKLDALPLSPNGKLDRKALPAPERMCSSAYIAPRNETEEALARVFAEVLKVDRVGVRDNFFELGGHSLLATRLVSRIAREFESAPPLASVFAEGTVEAVARHLERTSQLPLVPLRTSGSKAPLFLVHAVGGSVAHYRKLTSLIDYGRPVFGLQAPGLLGEASPLESLDAIAELYAGSIRKVAPEGPYLLGGWSFGGVLANEIARRLHERGDHVGPVMLIDSYVPASRRDEPLNDEQLLLEFALDAARAIGRNVSDVRGDTPRSIALALLELLGFSGAEREARFAVYRANRRALASHRPKPWDGQAILVRSDEHGLPDAGWREALSNLTIHRVPGADHYTLLTHLADEVGLRINSALAKLG